MIKNFTIAEVTMSEELNQLNELNTTQTDHEYGGMR